MTATSWKNVAGKTCREIFCEDKDHPMVVDVQDEHIELPELLPYISPGCDGELIIDWLSSGYSDPGQLYGPPEKCYPPEGNDDRTMDSVNLNVDYGKGLTSVLLPQPVQQAVFDTYYNLIENEYLPETDHPDC